MEIKVLETHEHKPTFDSSVVLERASDYTDVPHAMIESIINSLGAGASVIKFWIKPTAVFYSDNGRGMNLEILKAYLDAFNPVPYKHLKRKGDLGQFNIGSHNELFYSTKKEVISQIAKNSTYYCQIDYSKPNYLNGETCQIQKTSIKDYEPEFEKFIKDHCRENKFVLMKMTNLTKKLNDQKILEELPYLLPCMGGFDIYINDKKINPRKIRGKKMEMIKVQDSFNGENIRTDMEFFIADEPTKHDDIFIMVQGRRISLTKLAIARKDIPGTFFCKIPPIYGFIHAPYLKDSINNLRNDFKNVSGAAFDKLIDALKAADLEIRKEIDGMVDKVQDIETDSIIKDAIQGLDIVLNNDPNIKAAASYQELPKCTICESRSGLRNCPAVKDELVCSACCKKSWSKEEVLDDYLCQQKNCKKHGKGHVNGKPTIKPPSDNDQDLEDITWDPSKKKQNKNSFKVMGRSFYIDYLNMPEANYPSSPNDIVPKLKTRITINTGHSLYRKSNREQRKFLVRMYVSFEVSNEFGGFNSVGPGWVSVINNLAKF